MVVSARASSSPPAATSSRPASPAREVARLEFPDKDLPEHEWCAEVIRSLAQKGSVVTKADLHAIASALLQRPTEGNKTEFFTEGLEFYRKLASEIDEA